MSELMTGWFAFNVVFGLWSAKNWITWGVAFFGGHTFHQNTAGKLLDLVIASSCLAQYLIVNGGAV